MSKDVVSSRISSQDHINLVDKHSAHNYHPLPIVVARAEGIWVYDVEGKRYLDMLAAYSALNFGHCNPRLVKVAREQLGVVTLASRAFQSDQLGLFCRDLARLCHMDRVLPMNSGAEGVETAIKTARKWGYQKKGVPDGKAKIICCAGNFHGRTTTIISFSDDPSARADYGPFTPGFDLIPYGDLEALRAAIDDNTVAFLVEPIQGEGGIIIPPSGFLTKARELCRSKNVLFIADEIQSGLGRTGKTFTCEHEGVQPDIYILGKALGGGLVAVSAVVSSDEILGVFKPGEHGSTFGGNPLACRIGREVIAMLEAGDIQKSAEELGGYLLVELQKANFKCVREIRGRGLWIGIEIRPEFGPARPYCEKLMADGVLCKETHVQTIRLAPPLTITRDEIDWALERLRRALG